MNVLVIMPGFDEAQIRGTAASKQLRVDGRSFIVDWADDAYGGPRQAFQEATRLIGNLLPNAFVGQLNHHSTIVSQRLDPIDRSKDVRTPEWADPDFSRCREIFRTHLENFILSLQLCVCAPGGTIQLVYRNETQMPKLRQALIGLGAEVKPGTLDDDRQNTCTVVLGYLSKAPGRTAGKNEVAAAVVGVPRSIAVSSASLVRYRDTSLNEYETVETFH